MNKYSYLCIIMLVVCSNFEFACKIICVQDGDEIGVAIDNECYCANKRDITKIITRVPKNGKTIKVKYDSQYMRDEL